jgi:hypothetical protein
MQQKDALSHECRSTLQAIEADDITYTGGVPACSHAPICGNQFVNESEVPRVEWQQTMDIASLIRLIYPKTVSRISLTAERCPSESIQREISGCSNGVQPERPSFPSLTRTTSCYEESATISSVIRLRLMA